MVSFVCLHKGTATVIGRGSEDSLYVPAMVSYGSEDQFDHRAAEARRLGSAHQALVSISGSG